jgi:hypothetical protein
MNGPVGSKLASRFMYKIAFDESAEYPSFANIAFGSAANEWRRFGIVTKYWNNANPIVPATHASIRETSDEITLGEVLSFATDNKRSKCAVHCQNPLVANLAFPIPDCLIVQIHSQPQKSKQRPAIQYPNGPTGLASEALDPKPHADNTSSIAKKKLIPKVITIKMTLSPLVMLTVESHG